MSNSGNYTAIIDQDEVTDEVKDIAVKYDPLNRSGDEGFHVTEEGELRIDESKVMKQHKIIEKKIPNDSIQIVELPSASGKLIHQYDQNGFRLFNLPIPSQGDIVGLLGRNGIGKSTILKILGGILSPNFGDYNSSVDLQRFLDEFSGTRMESHIKVLEDSSGVVYKPQMVSESQTDGDVTVEEFLSGRDTEYDDLIESLELSDLLESRMDELSGGQRQRVYIAGTLLTDADVYLIDEPSSFLDIKQRFKIARLIREYVDERDARCVVVEHDMAVLDMVSDFINVVYGEPNNFGVCSQRMTSRQGINEYVRGHLTRDDIRIRQEAIEFTKTKESDAETGDVCFEYPELSKTFDGFSLTTESGTVYQNEVLGIIGKNALGKTTFAKLLAGELEPDSTDLDIGKKFSYKPQYPETSSSRTVRGLFSQVTNTRDVDFRNQVYEPLELDALFDDELSSLSGGQIQRVSIGLCLANEADAYLIDEPSAYLDIETREKVASTLRRFARNSSEPVMVIDHDMFVIDRIADRVIRFEGESGVSGHANSPNSTRDGMNNFLSGLGVTFRRDSDTNRPRANKKGSQLDREQKREGNFY